MTDFSHLDVLTPKVTATRYDLPALGIGAHLMVLPAIEANRPYFAELHQRVLAQSRLQRAGAEVSADTLRKNREEDRALYARHVIVGWSGIHDAAGTMVPFSAGAALDLLRALPDHMFDVLRVFCSEARNFAEAVVLDAPPLAKG